MNSLFNKRFVLVRIAVVLTSLLCTTITSVIASDDKPGPAIDLASLLHEMVNRNSATYYPDPAYHLFQTSSWDRAERNQQNYDSKFANKDHDNYIRKEKNDQRTEYVIMDAKGPGAITRWWLPSEELLRHRIVRVYIDNNPKPVIEENYKKLISGNSFVKWPFAFISSDEKDSQYQYSLPVGFPKQVGMDLYLPIPFSKACKVTLDDSTFYFVIDYRIYEAGTQVVSFSNEDYNRHKLLVDSIGKKLMNKEYSTKIEKQISGNPGKGQSIRIDLPAGTHAISQIFLKINSRENKQMNRAAVIQVIADGKQTVWSPVSEFFGGGVYARPVKNKNSEVTDDGWMISNWLMPYKNSATVIIKNFGIQPIEALLKVSADEYRWNKHSLYFHAGWHEQAPLPAPPFKDWSYIELQGRGRYAGDVLTVHSTPKVWWGEGDEKIYINGESFPSHLGTGLEDYYGYAWGMANHFNSPFISMPDRDARGKDNWSGYSTMARMRFLDDIPFDTSLKVDVEAWITQPGVSFSVTCFWYGNGNATSTLKTDTISLTRKLPDFTEAVLQKLPGEIYPDPPGNKRLLPNAKGNIRYVGNLLDLLAWKDNTIVKKLDIDSDNILGTDGFLIFGDKQLKMYIGFVSDSTVTLLGFITNLKHPVANSQVGSAYLTFPGEKLVLHKTGFLEVPGNIAQKEVISFTTGDGVPKMFRIGLMLDNTDTYNKVGESISLKNSRGEYSAEVLLAKSNRIPDWYFFDIINAKPGDVITVTGKARDENAIFSLGGITFDSSH